MRTWIKIGLLLGVFTLKVGAQTYPLSDTLFRKFLKKTYPTTVNTSGALVLAEAAKITGKFECVDKQLSNVDGLQYFLKLDSINLRQNNLQFLPDLSFITGLKYLNVGTNKLQYLPNLSSLKKLRFIDCQSNQLVTFPELRGADSLQIIMALENQIEILPDLSALKKLKELHVHYNKLKSVSGVRNVSSLEVLICYKNEIDTICDFSNLKKLRELNIGYNLLKVAPIIGNNDMIEFIYANHNLIDSISDTYSQCAKLNNIRLYTNFLTFRQLSKLIVIQDYNEKLKMNPQPPFKVAYDVQARQGSAVRLDVGIDKGVSGVLYEWYKNGQYFRSISNSSVLPFDSISYQDAGRYHCFVRHGAFSDFFITTDTFTVQVGACNDLGKVSFSVHDRTCIANGSVAVTDVNTFAATNKYLLESVPSGKIYEAQRGIFEDLTESTYKFSILSGDGCKLTLPETIKVGHQECEEVLLYPDSEGNNSYYFEQQGTVNIYDKRGNLIKTMSIPAAWAGRSLKGARVPSGFYVADINNGEKLIGITVLY